MNYGLRCDTGENYKALKAHKSIPVFHEQLWRMEHDKRCC